MTRLRYILSIALLAACGIAGAQTSTTEHRLAIMLDGAGATPLTNIAGVSNKMGGSGTAALLYEFQKSQIFFNIGVGANYLNTGLEVDAYSDWTQRYDIQGETIRYYYDYTNYNARQTTWSVAVPVQVGVFFGNFYVAAEARFHAELSRSYTVKTDMEAGGVYDRFIEEIRNLPSLGYYPQTAYTYNGSGTGKKQIDLWVGAEAGYRILNARAATMRIGLFVDYGVLNQNTKDNLSLGDYSGVDINPATQSQENLAANLVLHRLPETAALQGKRLSRLTFGVRYVCAFRFSKSAPCHCDKYLAW